MTKLTRQYRGLEFACQTSEYLCFRNAETKALQKQLGDPGRELIELKDQVQRTLLEKLAEIVPEFCIMHEAVGELGVYLNLAAVALRLRLVRPTVLETGDATVEATGVWNVIKCYHHKRWIRHDLSTEKSSTMGSAYL